jgi:hypothetical protein
MAPVDVDHPARRGESVERELAREHFVCHEARRGPGQQTPDILLCGRGSLDIGVTEGDALLVALDRCKHEKTAAVKRANLEHVTADGLLALDIVEHGEQVNCLRAEVPPHAACQANEALRIAVVHADGV